MGTGKTDMDRLGFFQEMGYVTVGLPYRENKEEYNVSVVKDKQILAGGWKSRTGLNEGYFAPYTRAFAGESYCDAEKMRRQGKMKESKLNLLPRGFLPPSPGKQGRQHYGTFAGAVEAFSSALKPTPAFKAEKKNFYTSPGKKGSHGYTGITIGEVPKYIPEPADRIRELTKREKEQSLSRRKGGVVKVSARSDYFTPNPFKLTKDLPPPRPRTSPAGKKSAKKRVVHQSPFQPSSPGKKMGGNKSGTFQPLPDYEPVPYVSRFPKPEKHVVNSTGRKYMPTSYPKSKPATSLLQLHATRQVAQQLHLVKSHL